MQELLEFYEALIKSAEDHQVAGHLQNLVEDAAKLAAAVQSVIQEAKQRVGQ